MLTFPEFINSANYEVKSSTDALNYVVFRKGSRSRLLHSPNKERTLVLTHGFGLGLGFFFGWYHIVFSFTAAILTFIYIADNYDQLLDHFDRIIAVDWQGMGCSGRTAKEVTFLSYWSRFLPWREVEATKVKYVRFLLSLLFLF